MSLLNTRMFESKDIVPEGSHIFRFEFEAKGKPDIAKGLGCPGTAKLFIDEVLVGQNDVQYTMPLSLGLGGRSYISRLDPGSPVCDDYKAPFEFTGKIIKVVIDVAGDLLADHEAAALKLLWRGSNSIWDLEFRIWNFHRF